MDTFERREPVLPFEVFKTIKLGIFKTIEEIIQALRKANCQIDEGALSMMKQAEFKIAGREEDIQLIKVNYEDLGFVLGDRLLRTEVYDRAKSLGLGICPPEAGPLLRLQFLEQPHLKWGEGRSVHIAMKPILATYQSAGTVVALKSFLLGLTNNNGLYLDTYSTDMESGWPEKEKYYEGPTPDCVGGEDYIFCMPRSE